MIEDNRVILFAKYLLNNDATVRKTAEHFGYGKSTVHYDLSKKLRYLDPALYAEVKQRMEQNYSEKHLRGGESTRIKYSKKQ